MSRTYSRSSVMDQPLRNSGPYEAIIVNHHDTMYMGSLEVEILRYGGTGNVPLRSGQLVTAKYLSPFYGVTPVAGLTNNDAFHQTQKSYGFWMIPPDVGTRVLVIFTEGDPNNAYWIGCIQDSYMNFMIPDGRAVTELTTPATPDNLKGLKSPVGEYSKINEDGTKVDPTFFNKPYNKDFAEILEIQGLLLDEARGLTTASARRETPSAVFGFSTPGPLDKRQNHPTTKYGPEESTVDVPYNRLGGSSIVMDDGDDKFIRATHAADGPPLYVNKEKGEEGGDETIPHNECIRIRTRTGHQILLHNSEDLIYITNSRGTAWIELTSDGKIDIHAEDSISIHTEQDFNFRAERDVNIEAGRNINMRASASWSDDLPVMNGFTSGNIKLEGRYDTSVKGGRNAFLESTESLDLYYKNGINLRTDGNFNLVAQNINTEAKLSVNQTAGGSWYRKAGSTLVDQAESDYYTQIGGEIQVNSNRSIYLSAKNLLQSEAQSIANKAKTDFNVQAASLFALDSLAVDLNAKLSIPPIPAKTFTKASEPEGSGVVAASFGMAGMPSVFSLPDPGRDLVTGFTGSSAYVGPGGSNSSDAPATSTNRPVVPAEAEVGIPMELHPLPRMRPGMTHPVIFDSIMKRVPQHEPWSHHENYDPQAFKPESTDALLPTEYYSPDRTLTPDTFMKNIGGRTTSVFVEGSGGMSVSSEGGMVPMNYNSSSGTGGREIDVGPMPPIVPGAQPPLPPGSTAFRQVQGVDGPLAEIKSKNGSVAYVAKVFQGNFQGFVNDLEATGYTIRNFGSNRGYKRRQSKKPGGGNSGSWSYHALGCAVDINPGENPYRSKASTGGRIITDMPIDAVRALCKKWGLGWGGDFNSSTDAMHFSTSEAQGSFPVIKSYGRVPFPIEPDNGSDKVS